MQQPRKNSARRSLRRGKRASHALKKAGRSFIQTGGFDKGYLINTSNLTPPAADCQVTVTLGDWKTDYSYSYRRQPDGGIRAALKQLMIERAAHFGLEYPPKVRSQSAPGDGLPKRLDKHTVHLPLQDNQGTPFPLIIIADTILEIITLFGGSSSDECLGVWPENKSLYLDPNLEVGVWTDDSEGLVRYAGKLAYRFRQLSIAVTRSPQTVWHVPPMPPTDPADREGE